MKDILSEIIAHKRIEIELQKQAVSLEKLQEEVAAMMQKDATAGTSVAIPVRSMKQTACFLTHGNHCRIQTPFSFERMDT